MLLSLCQVARLGPRHSPHRRSGPTNGRGLLLPSQCCHAKLFPVSWSPGDACNGLPKTIACCLLVKSAAIAATRPIYLVVTCTAGSSTQLQSLSNSSSAVHLDVCCDSRRVERRPLVAAAQERIASWPRGGRGRRWVRRPLPCRPWDPRESRPQLPSVPLQRAQPG